jgi:hypothetical protein
MTPLRPLCLLLVLFFSLTAWAGQGEAPLSPPELIPATDHDPEHLAMFVTHFFRWWMDNELRNFQAGHDTKDGKEFFKGKKEQFKEREILDQEREAFLEKSLSIALWEIYKNSQGDVEASNPIIPWNDSDDTWRDTIFSQIVTLQDHTATLIVSFPLINMGNPPDNAPLQLRILLQTQKGTWRIGGATEITDRDD